MGKSPVEASRKENVNAMIKTKRRLLITWTMALLMLLNVIFPFGTAFAEETGTDKTSALTNVVETITQSGEEIPSNGTLSSTEPIRVRVDFNVPVSGDDPEPPDPVLQGDTATFYLSDAFTLTPTDPITLYSGTDKVGTVSFATNPDTKMVTATVVFDGDPVVFDGTVHSVSCWFEAEMQYDASGAPVNGGNYDVQILNKTFTVNVPPVEKIYTVTKLGTPDLATKSIQWSVTVSATQAGQDIALSGYKFYDDLTDVGDYVSGSFLDGAVSDAAVWNSENKALEYAFPSDTMSPQTITFKTAISDEAYYAASQQTIANTAQLLDSENNVMNEGQKTVSFTPEWIKKTGTSSDSGSSGTYDPKDRTITWTITANQMGATLNNVVITDLLPGGLTLQSAKVQPWNAASSGWGTEIKSWTEVPSNGEYKIGDISSQILLTIVTKVPDEEYTTGTKTYTNSASIKWDGLSGTGIGSGNVNVGVGYNAITKSGKLDADYQTNRTVHWTVKVDTKGQSIPGLKVYDLLVYGDSIDLNTVEGIPDGVSKTDLTPGYNQKYIDTFSGTNPDDGTTPFTITVHPIEQNGERVADLLEITGLSTSAPNTFTFDSLVVNPDLFAGNKTSQVWNTATLFSADTKLNAAISQVAYPSHMLAKELLKREAMSDPAAGVNNRTTNAGEGFDYQSKSVIFRLSVNADGMDLSNLTDASGQKLGAATVTDTLPAGWEFTEFDNGAKYLIFEGKTGGDTSSVEAKSTTPLGSVSGLGTDFSTAGTAKFTFSDLDAPYVILVKAKPTDETAAGYFNANKTTTVANALSLQTERWTPGIKTSQNVSVVSQILDKTFDRTTDGELTWKVEYKPYDLDEHGEELKDTLPVGLDLRTDSSGALLINGNFTANELILHSDGTYTLGAAVPLEAGVNVNYDNAARVLSFKIPDSNKAYRFTYVTDITGEPGEVSNQVSLIGSDNMQLPASQNYTIVAADGAATLQRNGWIEITKIDGADKTPLSGAEFTLFTADGSTVIKTGTTDSNGVLRLKVIPDGDYILKETKAPASNVSGTVYNRDTTAHTLTVKTTGSTVTASIDGKTGENANAVTMQNYLEGTVGNLTISKTVAGNAADPAKTFNFTVTFAGADGSYRYVGSGVPDGTIASGDTISLAHGQSITIIGLPKDASYTVSEAEYPGYSTASTGETGTIVADATQSASFINTKNVPHSDSNQTGMLTISKKVAGVGADTAKAFDFTVTFSGASGSYSYKGNGVPNGTIKSGDTISLAHGQSITIAGVPAGAQYTVTEADYTDVGYTASSTGAAGVISAGTLQTAAFTNSWSAVPDKPEVPGTPSDTIGDEGTPQGSIGGEGSTPQGSIGDEGIPKGSMNGEKTGMPKTGDTRIGSLARLGVLFFSVSLAILSAADFTLNKKYSGKRIKK